MTEHSLAGEELAPPPRGASAPPPRHRRWPDSLSATVLRILVAGFLAGVGLWAASPLLAARNWAGLAVVTVVTSAALVIYLSPRRLAAKYLLPTTLLILAFQVFPVVYTMALALTNVGDGHLGSKQDAITAIETSSVRREPGSATYHLTVAVRDGGIAFLLADPTSRAAFAGDTAGLHPLAAGEVTLDPDGRIAAADGYRVLTVGEAAARTSDITGLAVPVSGGAIRSQGLSQAYRGVATQKYDGACDCVHATDKTYHADPEHGRFVADDGTTLPQGWKVGVGAGNLIAPVTDSRIRNGFLGVLAWNMTYAVGVVTLTAALGIVTAVVLHDRAMRRVGLYRTIIVLPYAMPAFGMLLVWRDMFNTDFGLINWLFGTHIDWLGTPLTARLSVLLVQLWLGFPYMFLVATGALQAIPSELPEAAQVDGANFWQRFRHVTLPLLLLALAPLLVSSFAFNFNNFNGVFLVTSGGPFPADDPTVGATDLLITYTYRLAFGQQGAQYGLAAAMSIYVYLIVTVLSIFSFRRTRAFKEVDL
ncbi:ABC transporter permease subunit [Dactylosporangium sp. NPDC000521]|uniref:ABC transporter permease subunit n=1 Tax=Dactylosporangium sp. NPDC000521 TaxID=3363975 RepID=UPI0036A53CBA